jgi:hypothetical protein
LGDSVFPAKGELAVAIIKRGGRLLEALEVADPHCDLGKPAIKALEESYLSFVVMKYLSLDGACAVLQPGTLFVHVRDATKEFTK